MCTMPVGSTSLFVIRVGFRSGGVDAEGAFTRAKTSASMIGGTDIAIYSSFGRGRFNRLSVQL